MKLVVFPPLGGSPAEQERRGQLERFRKYYLTPYLKKFAKVYVVSYSQSNPDVGGVTVLNNKQNIHRYLWQLMLPFVYRPEIKGAVFRVMQLDGLVPALIAKYLFGGKVVATFGYDYKRFALVDKKYFQAVFYWAYERFLLPLADAVIVPNRTIFDGFMTRDDLKNKIIHLPNGVDTEKFKPVLKKEKKVKLTLFSVGRLEKQKNYPFLIKAIKNSGLTKKLKLVIVGSGSQKEFLHKMAKSIGLDFKTIDMVPNEKLGDYYRSCDIYTQPSLIEGSPKTLLEAMSCGCCIVASRAPGIREVIHDGRDGLLFELNNLDSLSQALREVVNNFSLRKSLSRNVRKTAIETYDIKRVLEKEIKLMFRVTNENPLSLS